MKTVTAGRFFVSTLLASVILYTILPLLTIGIVAKEEKRLAPSEPESSLQFTSAGHILSFSNNGYMITSTEGMLNTKFVNSNDVKPISNNPLTANNDGKLLPLDLVTYKELWDGVTVTYESDTGLILKSTYYVDTPEQVSNIQLEYNRPVEIDSEGNLVIKYENGAIREVAPIAWQETIGGREAVSISYAINGEKVGFTVQDYLPDVPIVIDPAIVWNTFLGGAGTDTQRAFNSIVDSNGNIYLVGFSNATWGSPVRPYTGSNDIFVLKLNNSGNLLWNTFLGGAGNDVGYAITIDNSGNLYITGYCGGTWGSPLYPHRGGNDICVAKLNNNGELVWNTFFGGAAADAAYSITIDPSGYIYLFGGSQSAWNVAYGSPIHAWSTAVDLVVSKVDSNGGLIWFTFWGGTSNDFGYGIQWQDNSLYTIGRCPTTWGSPIRPYASGTDICVMKLDDQGNFIWNTFLGGAGNDEVGGIALDSSGNIYIAGGCTATWGSPISPYTLDYDGCISKLNNSGALQWNTFIGGSSFDYVYSLKIDNNQYLLMSGYSTGSFGSPINPYISGEDILISKFDLNGNYIWHSFYGSGSNDNSNSLNIDGYGNIYVGASSSATWGSPVRPYSALNDGIGIKIDDGAPTTTDDVTTTWYNSDVTTNLTCVDNTWGSGCLSTYYTTDGSTPTTGSSSGNSFVLSSQGVYTVKYFSVDNSTNTETVKTAVNTVNIDKTDPTGSVSIDSGATYTDTTSVTLTLSATDDLSGISQMKVSKDPLFTGVPWEAYNASKGFTLSSGDGVKTVYVMYQDLATNESIVYNDTITLDTTGPTGSITIDGGATYTDLLTVSLAFTADDGSGIGVSEMMISDDPSFVGAVWEVYNALSTFTLSAGDGVKTVYIKFRDTLNNEGPTYNDTITLDQTGPTGSIVINSSDTYTHHTTVTLTISATDATSSVDEMMVSEDPGFAGGVWEAYDTSIWFDMSVGDGVKTIYIKFKDILGNEGGTYSDTITLDQTNPTINITDLGLIDDVPDQSYLAYYFTSQTPFIQGMTEPNSTVYYVYGSNTYTTTADGTGHYGISIESPSLPRTWVTLKYHAVDLAGNLSMERTLVLIVGIENFPEPEVTNTPSVTPSVTMTITPSTSITPTITEMPQTGDITPTPILPTIVIYKVEGGDGTLLVGAVVTIDGQEYVSDEKGQIYVQGRPDSNPVVTIEYNGEVLSANISGSNITAGEAISQSTNLNYLFLLLLMILLAGGGYWIYRKKLK